MAEEKVNIKIDVETGQSQQNLENLGNAFQDTAQDAKKLREETEKQETASERAERQMKELKAEIDKGGLSMRDLSKKVQQFQTIALEAGRTSPIGKQAMAEAATLKDRLVDLQNETKRLSNDHLKLQGVMEGVGVMTAGFAGFQSMVALTGDRNEELAKTMSKVMAAQTLLNSVMSIKVLLEKESSLMTVIQIARTEGLVAALGLQTGATMVLNGATKAMNAVFLASPIGWIALAITGIVLVFQEWEAEITALIRQVGFLNDVLEWLGVIQSEEEAAAQMRQKAIKAEIDAIEKKIKAVEDARDKELAAIDDTVREIDRELKVRKAAGEDVSGLERTRIEQILERVRVEKEATEQIIKLRQQEIEKLRSLDSNFYQEGAKALEKANKEREKQVKELAEKEKDVEADLAAFEAAKLKERNDAYQKYLDEQRKLFEERKKFNAEAEKEEARSVNAIKNVNDKYMADTMNASQEFMNLWQQRVATPVRETRTMTSEDFKAIGEAAVMSAEALASSLGSISQLIGEESQKGVALQKAAAITQLLIDTAKGISSAVAGAVAAAATTGPAMPFVVGGYIATGIATVLAGIAQAKAILSKAGANVSLGGAGGGGGGSSVRQLPPRLAAVGGTVIDANRDQVQDMKVYVTETDISSTMSKVNVIENQAKIR